MIERAGLWLTDGKVVLLVRRAPGPDADDVGLWSVPGGHLENGESPLAAAEREFAEETGHLPPHDVLEMARDGAYCLVMATSENVGWTPTLCGEHDACVWADAAWIRAHWNILHPGLRRQIAAREASLARGGSSDSLATFINVPPTELARRLRSEKDPEKRKAMRRALEAWRLVEGNPLARAARGEGAGPGDSPRAAEGVAARIARRWLVSLARL